MASPWEYLKAGAQDFGGDITNMMNGQLTGPTMTNRRALMDAEPASFASRFGAMGSPSLASSGGLMGLLRRGGQAVPGVAPAVPADGAMQPTIGPGMPPAAAPQAPVKMGLPPGGILGLLQGQSPQGLLGLLQRGLGPAGAAPNPLATAGAGMLSGLPGMPGSPMAGPAAPAAPQLPMNINPMDQF